MGARSIFITIVWLVSVLISTDSQAEVTFLDIPNIVARNCKLDGTQEFISPLYDKPCPNKKYCMNSGVTCVFIDKEVLDRHKGNWREVMATEPNSFIQAGATVFCSAQKPTCSETSDLDLCANEPPEAIQCSMQDLPGIPQIVTIPKKKAGTVR